MYVLTDSDVSAQLGRNQRLVSTAGQIARLNWDAAPATKLRRNRIRFAPAVISRLASIFRQPASTLPAGS